MSEIYNVQVSVVELVRADSEEEAIEKVEASLRRKGYEPYGSSSAFESEPLDYEPDPLP